VSPGTQRFAARRHVIAFSLDVVGIVVFAAIGRRSHDETDGLGSVLSTAAPFLLGLLLCWGLIGSGASNLPRQTPASSSGSSPSSSGYSLDGCSGSAARPSPSCSSPPSCSARCSPVVASGSAGSRHARTAPDNRESGDVLRTIRSGMPPLSGGH